MDFDDVGEGGGAFVVAGDGHDGGVYAFALHAFVAEAHLLHGVYAGLFHDADVVGVVGDALRVCLVVVYFVGVCHGRFVCFYRDKVMLFWDKCQIIFRVYFLCFRGFVLQNDTFYITFLSFCLYI